MRDLSNKIYNDEDAARKFLEKSRWPDRVCCPFCTFDGKVKPIAPRIMDGAKGWYNCGLCRKRFTVRVGTIYERSHIPLHKWLMATQLMCSSKKGISAHQLHRMLNITYKSAWFMAHRIREGMKTAPGTPPLGGGGKIVEIDET